MMLFQKEKTVKIIFFFYIYGKNYNGWSARKNAGLEYVNLLINSMTHSLDPFMIMCNAKDVNYDDKLCVS